MQPHAGPVEIISRPDFDVMTCLLNENLSLLDRHLALLEKSHMGYAFEIPLRFDSALGIEM